MEIFKPIKGFESHYVISNLGTVQNIVTGYYPKKFLNGSGYLTVYLKVKQLEKNKTIHRLVADHFIPNHNNLPIVNHINSNKLDNSPENLEWVEARENQYHAKKANGKKTSQYAGVCYNSKIGKYVAQVMFSGQRKNIGVYKVELDAYEAVKNFHTENNIINRYI